MARRDWRALSDPSHPPIPSYYVSARELGRTWFLRSVVGRTLSVHATRPRRYIIRGAIDRALRREWQSRWDTVEVGSSLCEALPTVSGTWRPEDADFGGRLDVTYAARFLTSHCHLGAFAVPWDQTEWAPCPLCGDDFSRTHLVWECGGATAERERLLGDRGAVRVGDWRWLARYRGSRLGRFLRDIVGLVESVAGRSASL